jgi:hypothetical protein
LAGWKATRKAAPKDFQRAAQTVGCLAAEKVAWRAGLRVATKDFQKAACLGSMLAVWKATRKAVPRVSQRAASMAETRAVWTDSPMVVTKAVWMDLKTVGRWDCWKAALLAMKSAAQTDCNSVVSTAARMGSHSAAFSVKQWAVTTAALSVDY